MPQPLDLPSTSTSPLETTSSLISEHAARVVAALGTTTGAWELANTFLHRLPDEFSFEEVLVGVEILGRGVELALQDGQLPPSVSAALELGGLPPEAVALLAGLTED